MSGVFATILTIGESEGDRILEKIVICFDDCFFVIWHTLNCCIKAQIRGVSGSRSPAFGGSEGSRRIEKTVPSHMTQVTNRKLLPILPISS